MLNHANQIREAITEKAPLIHAITNPISINMCANAILALGARPVMAEHPKEVQKITKSANALCLNLGNITDARIKSIKISAKCANKNNIPYVLDLVGIGCSNLRKMVAERILKKFSPTVIKGNYGEIYSLFDKKYFSSGVDGDKKIEISEIEKAVVSLAKKYNTIVLATGKQDVISDGKHVIFIKNGSDMLSKITGTGCMLGCVIACYLSEKSDIDSVALGTGILGICGELSENENGNGTFFVKLLDNLSNLTNEDLKDRLKMEVKNIEKL